MRRVVVLFLFVAAALPAPALAQDPVTVPEPTAPATVQMTLTAERIGGRRATVLAGSRIRVRGIVSQYVPGEQVVVRVFRGARKIRARRVVLQAGPAGTGLFVVSTRVGRPGTIVVHAEHAASALLGPLTARTRPVEVLPAGVGPGSGRTSVRILQRRLRRLGYVVGRRGSYDARTARAVLAFRKVAGMARTAVASRSVMRRIARGGGRFRVRWPAHGRHVEADLSRQVLALVDHRRVQRIYPMSSGAAGTPTVRGAFRVYLKTPGTNAKGMLDSNYFIRGYAIHGYPSVPTYNASHGCLRVPNPEALSIYRWVRLGTPVDVYG